MTSLAVFAAFSHFSVDLSVPRGSSLNVERYSGIITIKEISVYATSDKQLFQKVIILVADMCFHSYLTW